MSQTDIAKEHANIIGASRLFFVFGFFFFCDCFSSRLCFWLSPSLYDVDVLKKKNLNVKNTVAIQSTGRG